MKFKIRTVLPRRGKDYCFTLMTLPSCKIFFEPRYHDDSTNKIVAVIYNKQPFVFLIKDWERSEISIFGTKGIGTKADIQAKIKTGEIILVDNFDHKEVFKDFWNTENEQ